MNKKILGIIIVILAILIAGAYQFAYVPYQQEQNNIAYSTGLQNASAMEKEINNSISEFNNINSSNFTAFTDAFNKKYQNEISPEIDQEIAKLNETLQYTNGNKTKEDYINYQIERIQLEKEGTDVINSKMNELKVAVEKNDYNQMLSIAKNMDNEINNVTAKIKPIKENIINLLNNNPSFNESVHNLTLFPEFYGDINITNVNILNK
ncbi:MAG: hypothetical protein E7Z85_04590 [Methanosphaera stadtmanae]|nr:hypothetical protein [Methanosphaera stadtmanae]